MQAHPEYASFRKQVPMLVPGLPTRDSSEALSGARNRRPRSTEGRYQHQG